jgi:hypothetical protein
VGGRVGDHLLDELAVLLLDRAPAVQLGPRLGEPVGDRVADRLERGDVQHPRPARGGDAPFDPGAREGRAEEPRQLGLQPGDLAAKVPADEALVALCESGLERRQDLVAAAGRVRLIQVRNSDGELEIELLYIGAVCKLGHVPPGSFPVVEDGFSLRPHRAARQP